MTEKKSSRTTPISTGKSEKKSQTNPTKNNKKSAVKQEKKLIGSSKTPDKPALSSAAPLYFSQTPNEASKASKAPALPLSASAASGAATNARPLNPAPALTHREELKEILLQVDKELLEILNRKVALELQYMEQPEYQAINPVIPAAGPSPGPETTSAGTLDSSMKLGTRYADWGLDHQRIESMVLLNRSKRGASSETCVRSVFREILGEIRRQHHFTRVAYLGPPYSYTHVAALNYFGSSAEMIPVSSIAGVFEEVHLRQSNFGVVPLENSTDGRIVDTLDMFTKLPVKISGEIQIPVHHQLLGNIPREKIRRIFSKPQALSQCRKWLSHHMNGVQLQEISSTTAAIEASLADPEKQSAAIAGVEAAKAYEIDILAENIEDNPFNMTRFAILGTEYYPRKGEDKTSVMFQLSHNSGTLADALTIFKRNRLNLTWIESFPIPGELNAYLFFVEMEGYVRDLKVRRALSALQKKTIRLEILGSYPKFEGIV